VIGNSNSYEKFMEKKRNDKFIRILKNLKPIYSAKRWEKEYEHQVPSVMCSFHLVVVC